MIWLAALIIGIVDAIVLYLFELVGIEGTEWLWNDLLGTDEQRWRVFPVAVVLGLALTAVYKLVKVKRVKETSGDLLEELQDPPSTLASIGAVLLVGAVSLLAGASLGPEAALMAFSAGFGAFIAARMKAGTDKQVLVLASVGALLVAFVHSILLVLIPLLILWQGAKRAGRKVQLRQVAIILLAGVAAFGAIYGIRVLTGAPGVGLIPALPELVTHDYVIAILLGFVSGLLALALNYLVKLFSQTSLAVMNARFPGSEWVFGAVAGLALGFLYYAGSPVVEFSGKIGTEMLVDNFAQFTAVTLIGFILIKLMATAWSAGTGYKGGLVFPSVFIGVAMGLLFTQLFPEFGGSGAVIGAISGMLTAVIGSPVMAAVFLVAALPVSLWPLAACAIVGTLIFSFFVRRITKKKPA